MKYALAIFLSGLLLIPAACPAQYLTFDASRRGHPLESGRPSIRLMGMGGLSLTVIDEDNEINLSDFGGNLAGIARDKDTWSMESWFGRNLDLDDHQGDWEGGRIRWTSRYLEEKAAFDLTYRKGHQRAIGLRSVWDGHTANNQLTGNSRVRGPGFSGFYNENVGALSLAIGVLRTTDTEDVVSSDIFNIRHTSRTWRTSMAAAYRLGNWDAGGQVDLDRVRIDGLSADPTGFHGDKYKWERPATRVRLTLVQAEPSRLTAGVNVDWYRRTGSEEAEISWSDRFPDNPSRTNFAIKVPTFEETEHGWEGVGRLRYQLRPNWDLGALFQLTGSNWLVEESPNSNFPGSVAATDLDYNTIRAGGGTSVVLLRDRLRLGAEAHYWKGTAKNTLDRSVTEVDQRDVQLRLGGEWFLPSDLVVRAGYDRRTYDANLDVAPNLYFTNGVTLGMGYAPAGGMVSLDAALQVLRQKPDDGSAALRKTDKQNLAVSARFLF